MKKLLVIQAAALGYELLRENGVTALGGLPVRKLKPVFPAVTCTAQAALRTGLSVGEHNMPANGFFDRTLRKTWFWEQSSALVEGPRIWDEYRRKGGKVGLYFFQQSLGENVDEILSPAPIHKHSGHMIMATYSEPAGLYGDLTRAVSKKLPLWRYWGPLASHKGSDVIASLLARRLELPDPPGLMVAYLPGLDYDLQRFGPGHASARRALAAVCAEIQLLVETAREYGYDCVVYGDYAITEAEGGAAFPNRLLLERGLMRTRTVAGMLYPDFFRSRAFAVADHQVAHVYTRDPAAEAEARALLESLPETAAVLNRAEQKAIGAEAPRGGELIAVAKPGCWFAWPWWRDPKQAPDYAAHVDIHNKPGFDPCELFFGKTPFATSQDTTRIRGTHGLAGEGCETALCSTLECVNEALSLPELARSIAAWLTADEKGFEDE